MYLSPIIRRFRTAPLKGILFAAVLLAGCGRSPDMVLVVVDTVRADHLATYGYHRKTDPNLEALAGRGLVFEKAYSHSGWTLPSMASLLTGLYPVEHGAFRSPTKSGILGRLSPTVSTLPELLAAEGYRTGAFVNNVYLGPAFDLNRGFDHYDYQVASNVEHRSASDTVEAALSWLSASRQPAFLLIHLMEPHLNYDPPPETRGRFLPPGETTIPVPYRLGDGREAGHPEDFYLRQVERLYDEEILAADTALGRLFTAVGPGSRRPAWLFITSDHGEEFWDHGGFEHGHSLHGELVRVPLVVSGPRVTPRRVDQAVQHVDLFRTLVNLAGGTVPGASRGEDLFEIASRGGGDRPILHEDTLFGSWQAALTDGSFRLKVELPEGLATLWSLSSRGQEDRLLVTRAQVEEPLRRTMEQFTVLRGTAAPVEPPVPVRINSGLDKKVLEELRSLGYLR